MSEGAFTTTVSTIGLAPAQRQQLDEQLRSEGIPLVWQGDSIQVDQAFESRVEGLVAAARSDSPAASATTATGFNPPANGFSPPAPPAYAPPGYPPAPIAPGYGYGYGPAPITNSNATMSLVLALIGWVVCPIAAIFGVVYGRRAEQEIAASGGTQTGEGLAKAGIIISWIIIGIYALVIIGFIVTFVMLAIVGTAASAT